ncbi:hypothetical protein D9619_011232 [Psilocybe cf. subviscida]|uniref:DUF8205 domain-containing protein n=1 Tax=Psilocybe cf. subviscida TaxID=2480587 RepID=A0A8H5BJ56_9AGAR|nr:hypothetical protein D9619_011232 [Psilocybe cf. subviscida]
MPIHQYIFDALKRAGSIPNGVDLVEKELVEGGPQLDIVNFINHINEEIRLDERNCLKLRAPMRHADKQLILDAYRDVPQRGPQAFRFKTFRERVYKSPVHHVQRVGRVLRDNDLPQDEKNKTLGRMMRLAIAGTPSSSS